MHAGWCCAGACNNTELVDGPAAAANGDASPHAALHVLCISPYPHYRKDRPTNPCLFWLGRYDGGRYNLEEAQGKAVWPVQLQASL